MEFSIAVICLLSCATRISAQPLFVAISPYPQLSNFTAFYKDNFPLASLLLANSSTQPYTVLVPNNDAFATYQRDHGYAVTSISATELETLLQSHVLVGALASANFSGPSGLTAPSLLVGNQYNNRSASPALSSSFGGNSADGQVVFISSRRQSRSNKFLVRASGAQDFKLHTGLSSIVNLTPLDGVWDGGRFQEIDQFLTLPEHCSTTIRNLSLGYLDDAINRTGIWDELDDGKNYTCLGPSDEAFANANHPEITLDSLALAAAMRMHTVPQVLYSNFLEDGQEYLSDNNLTIRVTLQGGDVFFNDAKVIRSNVITNNAVLHVLDKVMSPLGNLSASISASSSASQTASPTSTGAAGAATSISVAATSALKNVDWSFSSFLGFVLLYAL